VNPTDLTRPRLDDAGARAQAAAPPGEALASLGDAPWYKRSSASVVAGLAGIVAVILGGGELLMHALGVHPSDPVVHRAYDTRDLLVMTATAVWVGWRAHRAEQELVAARERARRHETALAEERWRIEQAEGLAAFSRMLAHELKSPLHAILLHGTVVERAAPSIPGLEGERVRAAARVIHEETGRMRELLDDYLDYGKDEGVRLDSQPLSLDAVASDAVAARRAALSERGLSVVVRAEAPVPPIHGDRSRLMRVIHHLIQHAIDVLPRGSHLDFDVELEEGQVVLRVTDDGPGFPEPDAVFRPFFTAGIHGTGLGFAVVRDIVRAHRGEVAARNVGARGARVEIRLPAAGAGRSAGEPR
jgi:signal transduction histidine kinase